ncbi:putative carbohydrate binding protein,copper amine oxidase family protein [Schinkia azotoformans MEV2011]|uniref:Putative carbohydrate binding protein,copper amine oxidase family protein n=1 Tax=Schinkia azotoformans MEV2011 TaxID=1348973 RepID=A0A072NT27_SCHAZ|nr:stalk domain-containing protein [Schinkia azotoformans]KEF40028.1 putative carbohydrate binding protein,copper amine oxidase family protein [Schinkia azotoformans MEV2011]MEC1694724.1 stalk domain-containing protein [Schinkia azotoformans]MEC1726407.1 stalk domain-containing protein [Schinkia azotoformans]MEC1744781.1 stalk domain-containing protein [Schinkia azotoformans]MEC1756953.1 stalk domain-containing protein [Schinkia azotoformans]
MGRKSYLKGLATGMVGTALFITTISTVDAFEPYYKNVKAFISSINIVLDGKPIYLKADPLLIDGTTYLPLRDIGEAFGKQVTWDGVNNTIIIGQAEKSHRPSTGIYQLDPIYGERYMFVGYGGKDYLEPEEDGGKITLLKQQFSTINSIAFLDGGSVSYHLYDNKFKSIKGLVGVDDSNSGYSEKGIIKFYGDNKELATITTGTKRDEPIAFEVDITGIEKLEIKNIKASGTASRVALVDVVLEAVQE